MTTEAMIITIVLFFAGLIQTTFGFGSALVAMPILSLYIGLASTSPLVCLFSTMVSLSMLSTSWKNLRILSIQGLLIGAFLGIPLGVILIKNIGVNPSFESKLNFILGVIVIAFSWFQLSKPNITQLKTNAYAIPAGFIAGVLGGAYNTNGPPIVMYGVIKKWDPKEFKASLQAFFIFSNIYIIGSHFYYGNFTPIVIQYSVYTLAPAIASILLGNYLSKKIPAEKFNSMVYVLFMCLGLFLCYKSSF